MSREASLSNLLKWSIENSTPSNTAAATDSTEDNTSGTTTSLPSAPRGLDAATLQALLGGPSDADLMRAAMSAIQDPSVDMENKLIAFDNFEQLIESLDNANNLSALGLWTPLLEQLRAEHGALRRMAAWCVGTAVQNNVQSQERALVGGAVPLLLGLLKTEDESQDEGKGVRRKVRYAVSSLVRNYQPGLDAVLEGMGHGETGGDREKVDAADMEGVDQVLEELMSRS